ncbi:hypothetical protein [Lacticaseibacillus pantheris]|uniref:hypothetical protein n=1 Tax=Lacticaseibacillus pantheris TaxID=171523 RepID=UPI002597043E|nr:hypothetical protein [Lacticaseibacillus pantheris]WKF84699.1 hypothetical protein QY874_10500 [Lacticaseibacillus pantheris]
MEFMAVTTVICLYDIATQSLSPVCRRLTAIVIKLLIMAASRLLRRAISRP